MRVDFKLEFLEFRNQLAIISAGYIYTPERILDHIAARSLR
jgi:hypothetical protein